MAGPGRAGDQQPEDRCRPRASRGRPDPVGVALPSVHQPFVAPRLTGVMRTAAASFGSRLAERLVAVLTGGPLGRPEGGDAPHWYAVWEGDVLPE